MVINAAASVKNQPVDGPHVAKVSPFHTDVLLFNAYDPEKPVTLKDICSGAISKIIAARIPIKYVYLSSGIFLIVIISIRSIITIVSTKPVTTIASVRFVASAICFVCWEIVTLPMLNVNIVVRFPSFLFAVTARNIGSWYAVVLVMSNADVLVVAFVPSVLATFNVRNKSALMFMVEFVIICNSGEVFMLHHGWKIAMATSRTAKIASKGTTISLLMMDIFFLIQTTPKFHVLERIRP
jgi:uncharacterized protein with PQ loop repeat